MKILNSEIEKMLEKGLIISLDFEGQNCLIFIKNGQLNTIYQEKIGVSEEVINSYSNASFDSILKIVLREKLGCCNSNPFLLGLMEKITEARKELIFYKEVLK